MQLSPLPPQRKAEVGLSVEAEKWVNLNSQYLKVYYHLMENPTIDGIIILFEG
jgi:hypothetical protein